ncbi:hypothetical protein DFJ73DRAFT_796452 [Zopfochytrium polystomum]|nr:hypothetical protein DFJ73DRAFT_796452 [Zopfochytrium polystomum]
MLGGGDGCGRLGAGRFVTAGWLSRLGSRKGLSDEFHETPISDEAVQCVEEGNDVRLVSGSLLSLNGSKGNDVEGVFVDGSIMGRRTEHDTPVMQRPERISRVSAAETVSLACSAMPAFDSFRSEFSSLQRIRMSLEVRGLGLYLRSGGAEVLAGITGEIRSGRMTAVVGPPGSGKSAFLRVLHGQLLPSQGSILLNGFHVDMAQYRKLVGYSPQDDVLTLELTVREAITHSARSRLSSDWSNKEIAHHVESVLGLLKLQAVADTLIGTCTSSVLTASHRKRASIAIELASAPLALFLDEPTANLDRPASRNLVATLHAISRLGIPIVTTISASTGLSDADTLALFDDVLVLAPGGRPIYFGPVKSAGDYFAALDVVRDGTAPAAAVSAAYDFLAGDSRSGTRGFKVGKKSASVGAGGEGAAKNADNSAPRESTETMQGLDDAERGENASPSSSHDDKAAGIPSLPVDAPANAVAKPSTDSLVAAWRDHGSAALALFHSDPAAARALLNPASFSTAPAAVGTGARPALTVTIGTTTDGLDPHGLEPVLALVDARGASWLVQVWLSLRRSWLMQTRGGVWTAAGECVGAAVAGWVVGGVVCEDDGFRGVLKGGMAAVSPAAGDWKAGLAGLLGGLAIAISASAASAQSFCLDRPVFVRESWAGHGKVASLVGRHLSTLPRIALVAAHFSAAFVLAALPPYPFLWHFAVSGLSYFCVYGVSAIAAAMFAPPHASSSSASSYSSPESSSSARAVAAALAASTLLATACGFAPTLEDAKSGGFAFLLELSAGRWGAEILYGLTVDPFSDTHNVTAAYATFGYEANTAGRNVLQMFVLGVGYRVVAAVVLVARSARWSRRWWRRPWWGQERMRRML